MKFPIFVISLARATDRRTDIVQRLDAAGVDYEIVDAVDGLDLDLTTLKDRLSSKSMGRGVIGCFLSHYNLWQRMIDEQTPAAVILEDDAVWDDDFFAVVQKLPTVEWQWDFINCSYARPIEAETVLCQLTDNRRLIRSKRPPWFTMGYVISLSGAVKLQKYCYKIRTGIDGQMREYWRYGLDLYIVDPPMGWQVCVESLISSPQDMRTNKVQKPRNIAARTARLYHKIRFALYHRTHKPKRK